MQTLAGLLNFACSVIDPGGAFLRRHIDLTIDRHPITVTLYSPKKKVKADLRVWNDFFDENNDKSFFLEDFWYTSEPLHLYTRFWCSFLKSLVLWVLGPVSRKSR